MACFAFCGHVSALDISLTNFPAQNPFVDTLRYSLIEMTDPGFYYDGKKRKSRLKIGEEKTKIGYKVWMQKKPAPLVVLLPGLGANYIDSGPAAIAEFMHENGFSVILISSAFNWEFVVNASSSGVPGYTPRDAQDIYNALQVILKDVRKKYGDKRITETILAGYSLGGLHTAFIADIDGKEQKINFARYVALSPPVNVLNAMIQLDELYKQWRQWSEDIIEQKKNKAVEFYEAQEENRLPENGELHVSGEEAKFAIGLLYRMNLGEVIKAIHARRDLGILSRPYNLLSRQKLEREIERFGYYRYALTFVKKVHSNFWNDTIPLKQLNLQASMPAIQKTLMFNPRITILHTANDWLLTDYDRDWLRNVMKDRLVMLDHGGHLGYFYRPDAQKIVVDLLKGETPAGIQVAARNIPQTPVHVSTKTIVSRIPDESQNNEQSQQVSSTSYSRTYETNDTLVFEVSSPPQTSSPSTAETSAAPPVIITSSSRPVDADKPDSTSPSTSDTISREPVFTNAASAKKTPIKPEDLELENTEAKEVRKDIVIEYTE
jgi:predicted alpha/beta-fold hydrolase